MLKNQEFHGVNFDFESVKTVKNFNFFLLKIKYNPQFLQKI